MFEQASFDWKNISNKVINQVLLSWKKIKTDYFLMKFDYKNIESFKILI